MYDYGARFYMSDILIFGTHDPMSEVTLQPYAYANNNPIFYNDPTGMEAEAASNDSSESESGSGGGEGFGDFGGVGNCPPNCPGGSGNQIIPATFGNVPGGFDGSPREVENARRDDVRAEQNIEGINWKKSGYSPSIPVSGSFVFPGGGNGINKDIASRIGNAATAGSAAYYGLEKSIHNSNYWVDAKGNIKSTKLLEKGANGKYVKGVQGYRNGYSAAGKAASVYGVAGKVVGCKSPHSLDRFIPFVYVKENIKYFIVV